MGRLVRWLLGTVVLVLVAAYAAAGWYLSDRIDAMALQVSHPRQHPSLDVLRVAPGRVTLVETDEDVPAIREDATYGLDWGAGYGHVRDGPVGVYGEVRGSEVTRRLIVLDGRRPRAGDTARLDLAAFSADHPEAATGTRVRKVRYASPVGRLPARLVPGGARTWAVLVHGGPGSTWTEALRAMSITAALGMPSLAIAYRNDPGAPADPTGRWGYGRTEWRDLEGAVRYALGHGARRVVLVGYGMGGAVTASFLQRSRLASRVSRVVLDSPLLDLPATVEYVASQRSVPVLGRLPRSLTAIAVRLTGFRYDVDFDGLDYLHDTGWVRMPVLVFHGDRDTQVPLSTSRRLADAEPDQVRLVVVDGAGYGEAWNLDPAAYAATLRRFLRGR